MRVLVALLFSLLFLPTLHAQCGVIVDEQNLFSSSDKVQLEQAALQVSAQHALPHVLTIDLGSSSSLEDAVTNKQNACPDWVAGGMRARNVIIFAVDSKRHKAGLYYGSRWHAALDDSYKQIVTTYMGPAFHDKEWSGGMLEGMRAVANQLKVAGAPKSSGTVVLSQPTDFSGFWTFLWWAFGIVALIIILTMIVRYFKQREQRELDRATAGSAAKKAAGNAADALEQTKQYLSVLGAVGDSVQERNDSLDSIYRDFSRAQQAYDLDNGSKSDLLQATAEYLAIRQRANKLMDQGRAKVKPAPEEQRNPAAVTTDEEVNARRARRAREREEAARAAYRPKNPTQPNPAPPQPIVVERESGTDPLLTGILGYELGKSSSRDDDDRPSRHSRRDDDDDSSSSSNGGGYSSSSSSSDSGGGGSSDYGSSDSGGGGGSDYGGSSDSGGGGSSDF